MSFITSPLKSLGSWIKNPLKKKSILMLNEGHAGDDRLLSKKGANLCELSRLGFSVPPAFILTSEVAAEVCNKDLSRLPDSVCSELRSAIKDLEKQTRKKFGGEAAAADSSEGMLFRGGKQQQQQVLPLLLSVRSGSMLAPSLLLSHEELLDSTSIPSEITEILCAPESWCIPGTKESCLGIGMNDGVVEELASATSETFALNAYAHFLLRFGTLVLGVPRKLYVNILTEFVAKTGRTGTNLTEHDLRQIVSQFQQIHAIPSDPFVQLEMVIYEIYKTWYSSEAINFRCELLGASETIGTSVIVQAMVFGGTGVCFTRSPISGEKGNSIHGNFWMKDGSRKTLSEFETEPNFTPLLANLKKISQELERVFRDMQQFEFIAEEDGKTIHILQVVTGRRTSIASMKIAVDMVDEKMISEREALLRIDPAKIDFFVHGHIDQPSTKTFGLGLTAAHGIVSGKLAFSIADCMEFGARDANVVLCMQDSSVVDLNTIKALRFVAGVISIGGSVLSNTSIACRGSGKPCIVALKDLKLIEKPRLSATGTQLLSGSRISTSLDSSTIVLFSSLTNEEMHAGDSITINGGTGRVYKGEMPVVPQSLQNENIVKILSWADKFRSVEIDATLDCKTVGDTIEAAKLARDFGVDGIGCIATEFLFSTNRDRLTLTRQILLLHDKAELHALQIKSLMELQINDLRNIFRELHGMHKITVKLLDQSLGWFLPQKTLPEHLYKGEMEMLLDATSQHQSLEDLEKQMVPYFDINPNFGLKGCRIASFVPEILEIQARSIITAALSLTVEGIPISPTIAIPSICTFHELEEISKVIRKIAFDVFNEFRQNHPSISMIGKYFFIEAILENPRICLRAEMLYPLADSYSFNTHNLTATTFGFEKDDSARFFSRYIASGIYLANPFVSLDDKAVGILLKTATDKIKGAHQGRPVGIAVSQGLHSSDARSIPIIAAMGVDCLSCPVERLPVAKIVAAQSAIKESQMTMETFDVFDLPSLLV